MRPTIGRVSLNGIVPLAWSLDACGPITRSIRDNALMLGVLAGEEPVIRQPPSAPATIFPGPLTAV